MTLIQFLLILWFFRNPKRDIVKNSELILSPADGKIVVINKVEENELNLGIIKLVEIPIVFTRYISKKAERKGRKEEKRKLKKLKEGIIIDSSNQNYKMRLKKNKGEFAFYIDFEDFQNN